MEERSVEARVHGRVLVRAASGTARGVLVGFHGYAESADMQMRRLEGLAGSGEWTLVSVQGLNRFYRGRSEDVVAGWMTRQDRERAIADNIQYVDRATAAALAGMPPASTPPVLVHAGYSQGVAMAFRAAVRGARGCAGVIAVGGEVPPELLADPAVRFPPVLLARGERDEWYTAAKIADDIASLEARGVAVSTHVFDGGHEWHESLGAAASSFIRAIAARQA